MTSELHIWLNDVPVIPSGNGEFSCWLNGAPVVDAGAGGGGGLFAGNRIVSPRRERQNAIAFATFPWRLRLVSPRISIGRSPST